MLNPKSCRIRLTKTDGTISYVTQGGETWIGTQESAEKIMQNFATSPGEVASII